MDYLRLERDAVPSVAPIRLDRPKVNALSSAMMWELGDLRADLTNDLAATRATLAASTDPDGFARDLRTGTRGPKNGVTELASSVLVAM